MANADATGTAGILLNYRWEPVVGDWDGDGCDTIGLYDPMTAMFYLRNSLTTGMADIAFPYGSAQSGWQPLIGDWNGDGKDSAGFFIYNANHFFLRDAFTAGMADYSFAMGEANKGWRPIVGNWRGPTSQTLMAADGVAAAVDARDLDRLPTVVQPVLDAALARWSELGHLVRRDPGRGDRSARRNVGPGRRPNHLPRRDAAGHGWFIDSTPAVDEEFAAASGRNDLSPCPQRPWIGLTC